MIRWEPHPDPESQAALGRVLLPWERTPYAPGQQCRGVAADCVRFVAAVLDELTGRTTPVETLPPDTCFHAPETALAGARRLKACFEPNDEVEGELVQPGDVLVTGPKLGGPGHAMIVGHEKNTIWHSAVHSVHRIGTGVIEFMGHRVFFVYRLRDRRWRIPLETGDRS